MSNMPIEVIDIGAVPAERLDEAAALANSLQSEFRYERLTGNDASGFKTLAYSSVSAPDFLQGMEEIRSRIKGYHPFLIAFTDGELAKPGLSNLFAANDSQRGLGIVSIANVTPLILPEDRLTAYLLYYIAHQTLGFIAPEHKNHDDTRGCVFDHKLDRRDLLKSMRARALCDECRRSLLAVEMLSAGQLFALDKLYETSGALLESVSNRGSGRRVRMFIGSSTEGLKIAYEIQSQLSSEFEIEVWNQGTTFGLGNAMLEALEAAVLLYDFGIFVFTPDDETHSRGQIKQVARDNVVFELGLFIGKLSRKKAFVVQPRTGVALPSDLAGIATASYDPTYFSLPAALGKACQSIRNAVANASRMADQQRNR